MRDATAEADFISDLGGDTVSAHVNDVETSRGSDGVLNLGEKAPQPAKVDNPKPDAPKELSLRDQISSAIKGEQNTPPAAKQDGGVARNPDGTFAAKPAEPVNPDPNAAPAQPAAQPVQAPRGMSPQDAEIFAKLPAETQQFVARTMDSLNQQAERFTGYGQMEQLIAPRREAWALNGMTEAQAVGQLLALSDMASRDPKEFVSWFAQQNGVDLEEIIFGAEPVDPHTAALQKEVQELRQQLGGMTTSQQQAAYQNTVNEITAFAEEKGQDGQPLRPYFADLGDTILPFIQAVKAQNPNLPHTQVLQTAYDQATWGNPTIRAKMQAAADAAAQAARIKEEQEAAIRARSAGSGIQPGVPSAVNPAATQGGGNLRDDIRAAIAQHS